MQINFAKKNAIVFLGDTFVNDCYKTVQIDSKVKNYLAKFEYRIVNLEAPVCDDIEAEQITKTGPNIRTSPETLLPILKDLGINCVALANNHILDYGSFGVCETLASLKHADIRTVGAGLTLDEARKPLVLEINNITVAILNFCEAEWSHATASTPGANPLDLIENLNQIQQARATYTKVVCLIHGGHEYIGVPSPRMVKTYRALVDFGADAVVAHHSHHISAVEVYKGAPIFYGLGNFLFTMNSKKRSWYSGLAAELTFHADKPTEYGITVISQHPENFQLSLASKEASKSVSLEINEYSSLLTNLENLQVTWETELMKIGDEYLSMLSPTGSFKNKWLISLAWRSGIYKKIFYPRYSAMLLNLIRCEAHRDAIQIILKRRLH